MAAYAFSIIVCAALLLLHWWQARTARDEALNRVMANVAVACLDRPINVRTN